MLTIWYWVYSYVTTLGIQTIAVYADLADGISIESLERLY